MRFLTILSIHLPLFLVGFGVGTVLGEPPKASEQLEILFKEINQAVTQVRYQAEQTVHAYSGPETQATRFRVQYAYPYRKRESLDGPEDQRFVMLEDGQYLWSYYPKRKMVVKEPLREGEGFLPFQTPGDLNLLLANYDFTMRGPLPLGEMRSRIVEFYPKRQDRPWREVWLEEQRKVPVRVIVCQRDGRPAYRAELSEIVWDPSFDGETFKLRVPPDTRLYEVRSRENLTVAEAQRLMHQPLRFPLHVPEGYRPFNIVHRQDGPRERLQIVYSDGLSTFSVFQEWTGALPAATVRRHMPPRMRRYGFINFVVVDLEGGRNVFVGDVPQEILLQMARSLSGAVPASAPAQAEEPESPPPPP